MAGEMEKPGKPVAKSGQSESGPKPDAQSVESGWRSPVGSGTFLSGIGMILAGIGAVLAVIVSTRSSSNGSEKLVPESEASSGADSGGAAREVEYEILETWGVEGEFGRDLPLRPDEGGLQRQVWIAKIHAKLDKIPSPPRLLTPLEAGEVSMRCRLLENGHAGAEAGKSVQLSLQGSDQNGRAIQIAIAVSLYGASREKPAHVKGNAISLWESHSGDWRDLVEPTWATPNFNENVTVACRWHQTGHVTLRIGEKDVAARDLPEGSRFSLREVDLKVHGAAVVQGITFKREVQK